jgi:general secretion pathway protein C
MLTNSQSRQLSHFVTFAVWALVAACLVFWALKWAGSSQGPDLSSSGQVSALGPMSPGDPSVIAKLLGATRAAAPAAQAVAPTKIILMGVLAGASSQGAALIAVGDKPAKPFRVGAQVDEGLILLAVEARRALLGPEAGSPPALTLELPPVAR